MALKKWTKEEEVLLRKYYPKSSKEQLTILLPGRTSKAIIARATFLGVKKAIGFGGQKKWSPSELEYMKKHYSNTLNSELCLKFNCSEKSLYTAANLLGVRKSAEYLSNMCSDEFLKAGADTRFKKGDAPKNKGKKWDEFMTKAGQENSRKTTFKKGLVPHNTREIGHERFTREGYLEVKIGDFKDEKKNFQLKHRLIWEKYYGPIPEKHQVRFIDGDKMNFAIENLTLVSLSDSLKINAMSDKSIVKRFMGIKDKESVELIIKEHKGIISLKRNAIKLNQQINKNGKKTKII